MPLLLLAILTSIGTTSIFVASLAAATWCLWTARRALGIALMSLPVLTMLAAQVGARSASADADALLRYGLGGMCGAVLGALAAFAATSRALSTRVAGEI
jgi:hypothetical protein